jgi:hypothetical protein
MAPHNPAPSAPNYGETVIIDADVNCDSTADMQTPGRRHQLLLTIVTPPGSVVCSWRPKPPTMMPWLIVPAMSSAMA